MCTIRINYELLAYFAKKGEKRFEKGSPEHGDFGGLDINRALFFIPISGEPIDAQ